MINLFDDGIRGACDGFIEYWSRTNLKVKEMDQTQDTVKTPNEEKDFYYSANVFR